MKSIREKLAEIAKRPPAPANTKKGRAQRRRGVRDSVEFRRIAGLERRIVTDAEADALAAELTVLLRTEGGTWEIRGKQGQALDELARVGGVVCAIRVGGGKTLITRMAPLSVDAERPVLILPAKLIPKTLGDFDVIESHFACGVRPVIVSYTMLGLEQYADLLWKLSPDLVIADEAHKLKNPRAAVTRRVRRYLEEHPSCKVAVLSGTLTSRRLTECAHLFEWALAERTPLPREWGHVTEWGLAIDSDIPDGGVRIQPGALVQLMNAEESLASAEDELAAVRRGVRRRMTETPGVVATSGTFLGASLRITLRAVVTHGAEVCRHVEQVRDAWIAPDGWPLADAVSKWANVNQLSHGFYYVWDPRPPKPWSEARRSWHATSRHVLMHNQRSIDSEKQLKSAIDRGEYDGVTATSNGFVIGGATIPENLAAWREQEPTFTPNQVPVWVDDVITDVARKWIADGPGILWVQSIALGERLSSSLGLPYYGAEAKDARGRHVRHADPREGAIVCSIHSCGEGENLQAFHRAAVFAYSLGGEKAEQLLGRQHRDGTEYEEVTVDWFFTCAEQVRAFWKKTMVQARYAQDTQGQDQKLLFADIVDETNDSFPGGAMWPELGD